MPENPIDWSQCEDVESVPGRVSGAWVIKGTRVPAQAVVDNAKNGSRGSRGLRRMACCWSEMASSSDPTKSLLQASWDNRGRST
jgi:hypothetical protein